MLEQINTNGKSDVAHEGEDIYYPSAEVLEHAQVKDWAALSEEAQKDPEGFWAARAEERGWYNKWTRVLDDTITVLQVVCGGQDEYHPQRHRPAFAHLSQEQTGIYLAG